MVFERGRKLPGRRQREEKEEREKGKREVACPGLDLADTGL